MTIATADQYIAATKQVVEMYRSTTRSSTAVLYSTVFDLAGQPGAGSLSVGNTANGIVPTSASTGFPTLNSFGGATGYLMRFNTTAPTTMRVQLNDLLFRAGSYAFNASTSLTSQPSYASRVPGGTDFTSLEIWLEVTSAITGNLAVAVTYTNEGGTTGHTTGTVTIGALAAGRLVQLPLQAGDSGVSKIESVTATVATVGTFNILVVRPLAFARINVAGAADLQDMFRTGMPQVWDTTSFYVFVATDTTNTGNPDISLEVAF